MVAWRMGFHFSATMRMCILECFCIGDTLLLLSLFAYPRHFVTSIHSFSAQFDRFPSSMNAERHTSRNVNRVDASPE